MYNDVCSYNNTDDDDDDHDHNYNANAVNDDREYCCYFILFYLFIL